MITTKNIENSNSNIPAILTIGTFDGMHIGHKHLIEEMLKFSNLNKVPSVVVTFNPNPFIVLNNLDECQYHLMHPSQK